MLPLPEQSPSLPWRQRGLALAMLLVWGILAARLVQLEVSSGDDFARLAARQRLHEETIPARPGDIVDRNGHVLATSIAQRSVYVVPAQIRQAWRVARQLAEALDLDADRLFERFSSRSARQFLWVKRRISEEEAERVRQLGLPRDMWGFRDEFRRIYPQGSLAAQVIGQRDIDGRGKGGIEESRDAVLRGADGTAELLHDARGRVVEVAESLRRPARDGATVVLTLDAVIQLYAEQALDAVMEQWKPRGACAIVLDPQRGEVLAMASRPTFDPNRPELATPDAWKNRSIADLYEPGSTFKPFVVAGAIEQGCVSREEVFDCENGEYRMGGRTLHDHHRYGRLSVADVLVKSSNIGMAKIGQRLTNAGLYRTARAFGFGGPTGIELPGERSGLLRPLARWNAYSTGSIPMGQEVSATPLQVVVAYSALANGGRLTSPRIVLDRCRPITSESSGNDPDSTPETSVDPLVPEAAIGATGHASDPPQSLDDAPIVSQAVSPEVADWVRREALTAVIVRGTGKKAMIRGYSVFGKTGTAQKPDPATGGYSRALHVSSFVCGAPSDQPRALVMIAVDEPGVTVNGEHFGGSVAAPAAGELLRRALERLGIAPDPAIPQTAVLIDELHGEYLE